MHHVLFTIPGIDWPVPAYGFMMMLGFLAAIWWATKRAERSGGNPDIILNCGFIALVAGVVGARAMFVYHYWDRVEVPGDMGRTISNIINVSQGGLEFYGGFILAVIAVTGYLVLWRHSFRWYLDIMAPSAMVGLGFGRLGCFLNGCCWGGVCTLPWAVTFPYASPPATQHFVDGRPAAALAPELIYTSPDGQSRPIERDSLRATAEDLAAADAAEAEARKAYEETVAALEGQTTDDAQQQREAAGKALVQAQLKYRDVRTQLAAYEISLSELQALAAQHHSEPVHPTQLYSAISAFLLAILLNQLYWRRRRDGQVIFTLLLIQPIARYLLEVIRADNPLDTLGFTISQALAVGLSLVGLIGLLVIQKLPARSPRARRWEPPPDAKKAKGGQTAAKTST